VYAGSPSHAEDLAFLRQVLERLEREQPGAFALEVVGGEPPGEATWYRRREIPEGSTGYPSYVALLREWRPEWDIAVAPLLDSEFNRHKSDLKFLEYAGLGLPGVYSAVEPYASVRDGETGRVVANDVEAWCAALRELAGDEVLRRKIQQQAWQEVRGRRLLRDHAGELVELLGTVLREGEPVPAPVPTDAQPAAVGSARARPAG
jgi:glycosyltransferase involved in cell wall biosynthesis